MVRRPGDLCCSPKERDLAQMHQFTLKKTADIQQRIDAITLHFDKVEAKVTHADTFRQRNMNYALAIFAGLTALRVNLDTPASEYVVSVMLLAFSIIFCVWDRRWHRMKHGWDSTNKICYDRLVDLTNDPNQDLTFPRYNSLAEKDAEWTSWQPVVFYLLVAGSVLSFCIH